MSETSATGLEAPAVAPMETPAKDSKAPERGAAVDTAATPKAEHVPFALRITPILIVVGLALGLQFLPGLIVDFISDHVRLPVHGARLPQLIADDTVMLLLGLGAIAYFKRRVPADYGLHWPRGNTYLLPAILWCGGIGVAMTGVDYALHVSGLTPPTLNFVLTRDNIAGWLWYKSVFVGPAEEIPYRALLVTYLAATMPGKVRLRGYDMNVAGLVVAAIFVLGDSVGTFITQPLVLGLARELCLFALLALLAYWLEKSKSVIAPIVGHSVAAGLNQALIIAAVMKWG